MSTTTTLHNVTNITKTTFRVQGKEWINLVILHANGTTTEVDFFADESADIERLDKCLAIGEARNKQG